MNSFSNLDSRDYIKEFNDSTEQDLSIISDNEWYTMAFKFAQRQDDKETECLEYLLLNSNRPRPEIYSLSALDIEDRFDIRMACCRLGIKGKNMVEEYFKGIPYELSEEYELEDVKDWRAFTNQYGYTVPTGKLSEALKSIYKDEPVMELMAGTGLLSKSLHDNGVNIQAIDSYIGNANIGNFNYFPIEKIDVMEALEKYGTYIKHYILCWAPLGDTIDCDILNWVRTNNPTASFLVLGESQGSATGSYRFYDLMGEVDKDNSSSLNSIYKTWYFSCDQWRFIK